MKTLRLALAAVLMVSITQAQVSEKELLKKTEENPFSIKGRFKS